jgi:hypothetical protein
MESTMLDIKYLLFLAMETFVVAAMGAALIVGLYQIVREKIAESRRLDKLATEASAATEGSATAHYS